MMLWYPTFFSLDKQTKLQCKTLYSFSPSFLMHKRIENSKWLLLLIENSWMDCVTRKRKNYYFIYDSANIDRWLTYFEIYLLCKRKHKQKHNSSERIPFQANSLNTSEYWKRNPKRVWDMMEEENANKHKSKLLSTKRKEKNENISIAYLYLVNNMCLV